MRYYFIIVSQDFLFYQEPIEEIIRERINHYSALRKEIDFFVITDLSLLGNSELQSMKQKMIKPSAAIISLNPKFIDWLQLRMQCGITGSFVSSSLARKNTLLISDKEILT